MNQVKYTNGMDGENPTGGTCEGIEISIKWQDGPRYNSSHMSLDPANGALIADAIRCAIQRLEFFQESRFKCRENALAITKLEESLHWLFARSLDRQARNVEGKNEI